MGLLLPALGQGLVTIAEDGGATSGLTALLIAAVPLWVACYRAMAGDRPPATTVLGVLVGFAGAALLVAGHGVGAAVPTWTLLAVVAASVAWALGSWLQPHLGLPRDPFVVVVYEMLVGGVLLTMLGLGRGEHFDPAAYSGAVVGRVDIPRPGRIRPRVLRVHLAAADDRGVRGRHLRLRQPGGGGLPRLAGPQRTGDVRHPSRRRLVVGGVALVVGAERPATR